MLHGDSTQLEPKELTPPPHRCPRAACMDGVDAVVKDDGEPTPSFADRSGDFECPTGFTNTYSSAISGCHTPKAAIF